MVAPGSGHHPMKCTAKSKRSGKRCRRDAMLGRNVCYIHGGKTPRGLASPHTKLGRWSKDLPLRLAARYQESQGDHRLLELREDIALLDARTSDVLQRVDTGESGEKWRQLRQAWAEYKRAGSGDAQAAALGWVGALITIGADDWAAWDNVRTLLEQRRRLVESERRRVVELQQVITAERAALLFGLITETIRRHVKDPAALGAIAEELGRLAGGEGLGDLPASNAPSKRTVH